MSSHSLPPARKQHHGSPRHNRLCWVIQKCAEELAYIRRVNASETEPIPLAKRPPMALEIDCCTLTNRVNYDAVCIRHHKPQHQIRIITPYLPSLAASLFSLSGCISRLLLSAYAPLTLAVWQCPYSY